MSHDFQNPYGGGPGNESMWGAEPDPTIKARILPPAILLIVSAVIGFLFSGYFIIAGLVAAGRPAPAPPPNMPPAERQGFVIGYNAAIWGGPISGVISIPVGILIIVGAVKMMNLNGYGMARLVSILAMIPCVGPCCGGLGLPIGIWALVVLSQPDVKAAFRG